VIGTEPVDGRLHWIVSDAAQYEGGHESFTALQKGGASQWKEVRVRRRGDAVHVAVAYGTYGFQVTHQATIGRRSGDFQGIGFQITHRALDGLAPRFLDALASLLESGLRVFVDDLLDEKSRLLLQVYYHPTDSLGPARLNASFVRVPNSPDFPDSFIALLRGMEGEISHHLLNLAGGEEFKASGAFIKDLLSGDF
jgi:hypothetical protein